VEWVVYSLLHKSNKIKQEKREKILKKEIVGTI